jgi:hypothetical protein
MRSRCVRHLSIICTSILAFAPQAFGWGNEGHEAIGDASQTRLNAKADAALAKILLDSDKLPPGTFAKIATWPDEVRARASHGTVAKTWTQADVAEADKFNADHKKNGDWHFVNLPLGASAYPKAGNDPATGFTSDDDIVHALNRAIAILESPTAPPDFSKLQAVRWIVHLVGDIHQPMHVTTGYYKSTPAALKAPKLIRDPHEASRTGVLGDRGGNGLHFSASEELHALWDVCLVQLASATSCSSADKEYSPLSKKLRTLANAPSASKFNATGDHHDWAAEWATDALKEAVTAGAYGVNLRDGHVNVNQETGEKSVQATITSPQKQAYQTAHVAAAQEQLVKATVRLADLFNAINWK